MLYCVFVSALGDTVLGSLEIRSVLELLFSFNKKNCISEYIYRILDKKQGEEWKEISQIELPEDFIREFQDKVNWECISCEQYLSEEFVCEFRNRVDWFWISRYQKLTEEFVREFRNRVSWEQISFHQNLSEEFVHEFRDSVNWGCICCWQKLSEEFIREFRNRID